MLDTPVPRDWKVSAIRCHYLCPLVIPQTRLQWNNRDYLNKEFLACSDDLSPPFLAKEAHDGLLHRGSVLWNWHYFNQSPSPQTPRQLSPFMLLATSSFDQQEVFLTNVIFPVVCCKRLPGLTFRLLFKQGSAEINKEVRVKSSHHSGIQSMRSVQIHFLFLIQLYTKVTTLCRHIRTWSTILGKFSTMFWESSWVCAIFFQPS